MFFFFHISTTVMYQLIKVHFVLQSSCRLLLSTLQCSARWEVFALSTVWDIKHRQSRLSWENRLTQAVSRPVILTSPCLKTKSWTTIWHLYVETGGQEGQSHTKLVSQAPRMNSVKRLWGHVFKSNQPGSFVPVFRKKKVTARVYEFDSLECNVDIGIVFSPGFTTLHILTFLWWTPHGLVYICVRFALTVVLLGISQEMNLVPTLVRDVHSSCNGLAVAHSIHSCGIDTALQLLIRNILGVIDLNDDFCSDDWFRVSLGLQDLNSLSQLTVNHTAGLLINMSFISKGPLRSLQGLRC